MVKQVNHIELKDLLKHYYKHKLSFFIWGTFGIGKSMVVRETAKDLAKERNREFREWNKMTEAEKDEVFENPKKYFVLCDFRLSEYDSSDIKGLPEFKSDKKSIDFKVPYWALFMELPDSDGLLFFDEINLATPLVISSCYKIIYDRVVNDSKMSEHWGIIGAGNLAGDRAYTHEIAPPLRDRAGEVELTIPNGDDWSEWAMKKRVNSKIIGFIKTKTSNLHKANFKDQQKFTTPRGWERVSRLIEGIGSRDYDTLSLITTSAIGEGLATEFLGFCKIQDKINIEAILKDPKKIKEQKLEVDVKFFLVTALADRYRDKKIKFEDIVEVSEVLGEMKDIEFIALLWRMCMSYREKDFEKSFLNDLDPKIAKKYADYIGQ